MKKYIIILSMCITGRLSAQNAAFVSQDSILASQPMYKVNVIKIDSLKKMYQEDIKIAKEKLNENLQKLLSNYDVKQNEEIENIKKRMTATDLSKLELIIDEDKFIEKKIKNYDLLLSSEYKNLVQPILDKVNTIITNYALNNKLDAVYILEQIRPALTYINRDKDVTKTIIGILKSQK